MLYYRNPMGLPDTSPTPKKDQMGMDYIPVYEGEDEGAGDSGLKISAEKIQKMGVKAEPAKLQVLDKNVRASGRVEIDESRSYTVTAKFEGYIERLHVNTTGQPSAAASRCSRCTARNWSRPSANTPSPRRASASSTKPAAKRNRR